MADTNTNKKTEINLTEEQACALWYSMAGEIELGATADYVASQPVARECKALLTSIFGMGNVPYSHITHCDYQKDRVAALFEAAAKALRSRKKEVESCLRYC